MLLLVMAQSSLAPDKVGMGKRNISCAELHFLKTTKIRSNFEIRYNKSMDQILRSRFRRRLFQDGIYD